MLHILCKVKKRGRSV